MIVTKDRVEIEKTKVEIKYKREQRRLARLERTARLHMMEQKLKRFKKIKFVKEEQGVRLHCSDSQFDKELWTYDFYEEVLADMHATKVTVRDHYLKPWKNKEEL